MRRRRRRRRRRRGRRRDRVNRIEDNLQKSTLEAEELTIRGWMWILGGEMNACC
jgi:hypothetical protein